MHVAIEYAATRFEIAYAFLNGSYDPYVEPEDIEGADYIDDVETCDPADYKSILYCLFDKEETSEPGIVKLIPKEGDIYRKLVKDAASANRRIANICEDLNVVDPMDAIMKLHGGDKQVLESLLNGLSVKSCIEGDCGEPVVCLMQEDDDDIISDITICGLSPLYIRLSKEKELYLVTGKSGSYHC